MLRFFLSEVGGGRGDRFLEEKLHGMDELREHKKSTFWAEIYLKQLINDMGYTADFGFSWD